MYPTRVLCSRKHHVTKNHMHQHDWQEHCGEHVGENTWDHLEPQKNYLWAKYAQWQHRSNSSPGGLLYL